MSEENNRVLLVEGQDDLHVVSHLWSRYHSERPFCIIEKGGLDPLLRSVEAEIKAFGREAIGILIDANDSFDSRWQSVIHHLKNADVISPAQSNEGGLILEGRPRVGVWLMPNNRCSGELEDFVRHMIPADDGVWPLAERFVDSIPEDSRKFSSSKSMRAKLHAWLAVREDPSKMGQAIRAGELSSHGPNAQNLVSWLAELLVNEKRA